MGNAVHLTRDIGIGADVTGDGKVTIADAGRINAAGGKTSLWT